jgi:hypothetical protein
MKIFIFWDITDVSEEHVASVFRVEERAKQETSVKQVAKCSSETSVDFSGLHGVIYHKIELSSGRLSVETAARP